MLDIQRALKQDRLLRALTGLNRKAAEGGGENLLPAHFLFDALLPVFSEIYD